MAKRKKKKAAKNKSKKKAFTNKSFFQAHASVSPNLILQESYGQYCQGNYAEAMRLFDSISNIPTDDPDCLNKMGVLAHMLGKTDIGLDFILKSVKLSPSAEYYNNLGLVQEQSGNLDEAVTSYEEGIKIDPQFPLTYFNRGNILQERNQHEAAIKDYQKAIELKPDYPKAYNNISLVLKEQGHLSEAQTYLEKAISFMPNYAEAYNNLGSVLCEQGQDAESQAYFQKAISLNPDYTNAYNNLGLVFLKLGQLDKAETCLQKAVSIKPDYAEAYNNLGTVLIRRGQLDRAEPCLQKAISLKPDFAEAYNSMGSVLCEQGQLTESQTYFQKALSLKPDFAEAYINLATALRGRGQLNEAETCLQKALSFKTDSTIAYSNLLFTLSSNPDSSAKEYLKLVQDHGAKLYSNTQVFNNWTANSYEPPPLRVGLVSGDLRSHPVGFFLESVLQHIDQKQLSLYAYVTQPFQDELTSRLKACCTMWRSLVGLSDIEAARCIYDDTLHILIDLSGHTEGNRLTVFARKPAPIQVSWLGYFATTGLKQMDYLLADRIGVPVIQQEHFVEDIWYLPETRLCFTPPDIDVPISPLPALINRQITFGCFQNPSKLNDTVITLWSRILAALPNSALRLQNKGFDDAVESKYLLKRLGDKGIKTDRVVLFGRMPRKAYLTAYSEVDVLLDTFPYPGGTTTCEGLWMGVPTLTLSGDTLLARQGASLLTAAGLSDWVTNSEEEYIAKASSIANDLPDLAQLRKELRQQVKHSPLFDAESFASNLQTALLAMWRTWCEKYDASS